MASTADAAVPALFTEYRARCQTAKSGGCHRADRDVTGWAGRCPQRVGLTVASHAWRSECIADSRLYGAGTVCAVIGVLLSVGAVVTGLIGVIGRDRARGAYLVMGIAAVVIGVVGGLVCLEMFREYITPHALPPHYQHQC